MAPWMRLVWMLIALLAAAPAGASVSAFSLDECLQECAAAFPAKPPAANAVFPHEITFERDSDQGHGNAAVLFRTLQAGSVTYVSVNGEVARLGIPYKGCPVFIMGKPGGQYSRPLKFVVKTSDGKTYVATSGTAAPTTPTAGLDESSTYTSYGVRNGGRQAWRIPKKGPAFGSRIKVVFSDGHTVIVNDTSHNYRESDGFVFKPGLGPNGEGEANTGTAHGGVYLHAPYGNKSKQVTFYY